MKQKLTIFIVLFGILISFAQNSNEAKLDSILYWLETHIKNPKDSTLLGINSLKAIQLAKKSGNKSTLAKSFNYITIYHKEFGQLDSALYYIEKEKDVYLQQKNDLELANAYLKHKDLFLLKADYAEATKNVYKALDLYEKLNNKRGIALCYASIGDLKYYERSYAEGVEWCDKAIAILKPLKATEDLANTYRIKANDLLFSSTDYEETLATINTSINLYKSLGETGIPMMASVN